MQVILRPSYFTHVDVSEANAVWPTNLIGGVSTTRANGIFPASQTTSTTVGLRSDGKPRTVIIRGGAVHTVLATTVSLVILAADGTTEITRIGFGTNSPNHVHEIVLTGIDGFSVKPNAAGTGIARLHWIFAD